MTDWDADSEQLRINLHAVLSDALRAARRRLTPSIEQARAWQSIMMMGLEPPTPEHVGRFRGKPGLTGCEVEIGGVPGVASDEVAEALKRFEEKLRRAVTALDSLIGPETALSADDLAAVIDLCAWVHAEWIRIHPFANGNGRTARLWANVIAMRYGLPPFVRLRPRPEGRYDSVAADAMAGRWQNSVRLFRQMYAEALRQEPR